MSLVYAYLSKKKEPFPQQNGSFVELGGGEAWETVETL
jgi:hypothetical protein